MPQGPRRTIRINVAFLIYNRPALTQRVFDAIAAARPERLLVVADGPKDDADQENCTQARAVVDAAPSESGEEEWAIQYVSYRSAWDPWARC